MGYFGIKQQAGERKPTQAMRRGREGGAAGGTARDA